MKRIISILTALFFILGSLSISSFAVESTDPFDISNFTDERLDLSNITMDELLAMSSEEFSEMVLLFEEVYNPFGSYSEFNNNIIEEDIVIPEDNTISPLWDSGEIVNGEWTEVGCHELITMKACNILLSDRGFFENSSASAVATTLYISLASMLPDTDEIGLAFSGHFYNPATGNNYLGSTTDTALTRAANHYANAISYASSNNMTAAYESLGRCLHYVQDVNVPHHANNTTGLNPSHSAFENYALENFNDFTSWVGSFTASTYDTALNRTIEQLVHSAASSATAYTSVTYSIFNENEWVEPATNCLVNAIGYSAMVLYKFGCEPSVPFYSN